MLSVTGPFDDFPPETLDFIGCHIPEVLVQGISRFELLAINEQCTRTAKLIAVLIVVTEEPKPTLNKLPDSVVTLTNESRNIVVNDLGYRAILTDDDEARRDVNMLLPEIVRLFVVPIECFKRRL